MKGFLGKLLFVIVMLFIGTGISSFFGINEYLFHAGVIYAILFDLLFKENDSE